MTLARSSDSQLCPHGVDPRMAHCCVCADPAFHAAQQPTVTMHTMTIGGETMVRTSNTCYEGRGGASGRHCNFYPSCVCGDRDALGKAPSTDVAALFAVQQENKRLRGALAAIAAGTPDLLPPYRAMEATQLREIASKALGNKAHENETCDDARWIREAKGTLDKLYGFLQAKNVPHAVDTRDWIDNALRVLDAYEPAQKADVRHGIDCVEAIHQPKTSGYLHESGDCRPYDVDGVMYCGRCHECLPSNG